MIDEENVYKQMTSTCLLQNIWRETLCDICEKRSPETCSMFWELFPNFFTSADLNSHIEGWPQGKVQRASMSTVAWHMH